MASATSHKTVKATPHTPEPPSSTAEHLHSPEINEIIHTLQLSPHPEGGYFKETFRDPSTTPSTGTNRAASTSIYYLLTATQRSLLHRIDASEGWHHYAGGPLQIIELDKAGAGAIVTKLGKDLSAGERPQYTVRAGRWFGAKPAAGAEFCLVGCTVAPGFEMEKFEFGRRRALLDEFPSCREWVEALTEE